ncbi:MAG: hypothetical protein AB8B72_04520 [Crocinitomicaceae bacterium]
MFGLAIRKRIDEDQLSNIFVNALLEAVENGFKDVANAINEDPAFATSPNIAPTAFNQFILIIITANLNYLQQNSEIEDITSLERKIIAKYADIFGQTEDGFQKLIDDMASLISQVNYPSKNYAYGISKAVFYKYNLNDFQESYFQVMNTPNPLFLKRMDEITSHFLWDWDTFFKKHKLQ